MNDDFDALTADLGLTFTQESEAREAFLENPDGFERVIDRTATANSPAGAFLNAIRRGDHKNVRSIRPTRKKPTRDLDTIAEIGVAAYHARTATYPPIDEPGWTNDDAISYAVEVASHRNSHLLPDDIERQVRYRIGHPWTAESDPTLGTGCPPELLRNLVAKASTIGSPPQIKPEPATRHAQPDDDLMAIA
jgi:hypothetical protein